MATEFPSTHPPDGLDQLVGNLLDCGGVLSQIIAAMARWDASGRSVPDRAPIPETAHSLIHSVVQSVARDYSKRDIKLAAKLIGQMTKAMCDNIFAVDPEWSDEMTAGWDVSDG